MAIKPLYHWTTEPDIAPEAYFSLDAFPRIMQRLLYSRGIRTRDEADLFLTKSGSIYDPFLLSGMAEAVETIFKAIDERKKIVVYGDYDVDGVTASAIMMQALRKYGANVSAYIPNRFEEGYGLNKDAIQGLSEAGAELIITVDCGIRSAQDVAFGLSLGLSMVISDHHEPGEMVPQCAAVVNPKMLGDAYPDKNLAGVGLAYKIVEALLSVRPILGVAAEDWLDLVAIGTVADIVPLTGENRCLVKEGLARLRKSARPSIAALAKVSGFQQNQIKASTIGFTIGPRLNVAGRLETARLALDLLMSESYPEALKIAEQLNEQNKERQIMTREIQTRVVSSIDSETVPLVICARDETFNRGLVGLAASKVSESFCRPSMVGAIENGVTVASCRSIPGFHLSQALDECADLMERYGGHAMAAGLTIKNENWSELAERLNQIAARFLTAENLIVEKKADLVISLDYLQPFVLEQLNQLEPFGQGNPEPLFIVPGLRVKSAMAIGKDKSHLRLSLISDANFAIDGIAFSLGGLASELPEKIDVLCSFEKNIWNNRESLQLQIRDIRPAQAAINQQSDI